MHWLQINLGRTSSWVTLKQTSQSNYYSLQTTCFICCTTRKGKKYIYITKMHISSNMTITFNNIKCMAPPAQPAHFVSEVEENYIEAVTSDES
jgi:hypothetical protein